MSSQYYWASKWSEIGPYLSILGSQATNLEQNFAPDPLG